MPDRAQVVLRVDPVSAVAVVVVSGTADDDVVVELGGVLHRAAEVLGPHVRVDLTACDDVAPVVLDLLRAEQLRLHARGGSLAYHAAGLDGAGLDGAGRGGAGPDGASSELSRRLAASLHRRTDAVDVGPERSEAGRELLALLRPAEPEPQA